MNRKIVVYDGLFALRTVSYLIWIFCLLAAFTANAQVSVLTHHNNNDRTGANLNETLLNTTNVNVTQFGKLFSYPVDADIYTQPLYAPGVNVTGKGTHNVVYVATMNDSVYAFDADSNTGSNAQPLWQVNFTSPPNITTVPVDDVTLDTNSGNIRRFGPKSAIGIMGTPVIDPGTNTLYLVARTKETVGTGCSTNSPCYVQRLHALDIRSGAEQPGSPKTIQATGFDPRIQNQRPGLALANGVVYLAWSSHDDSGPYHGWVMGYDAATLTQTGVFNDTPSGSQGGIWQSGQPPAVDATGNLYLMTGNGSFDISTGGSNVSQSFIKLSSQTTLLDWFAQCDADIWNAANEDLNSGGVLLIPSTNFLFGGGKEGRFFLLNRGNLGHIQRSPCNTNNDSQRDTQISQTFKAITGGGHIHGSPVYYDSSTLGKLVYVWGEMDFLKAFSFNGSTFNTTPVTQSGVQAPQGMPGGFLSLSANGNQPGTGILWAAMPYERDAENAVVQGILRAFDAVNLTKELWNSRLNFLDDLGNFAKFVPPTIANGKVYMATFNGEVVVYGLIPNPPPASEIAFVQVAATTPSQAATVAVAFPKNQFSGDLNVVVVGWNDTTSTIQSVTDTAGNTYNLAIGPTKGTNLSQSIYYAKNIHGGSNTVTVQFNNTASYPDIRILEYFGVDPVSPLDVVSGASGNSNQSSSGPATITTANELLLAANTVFTSSLEAGFPFVERIFTTFGDAAQDSFVNTIGTYNATAVLGSQGPWVMQMVTFRGLAPTLSVTGVSPNSGSVNGGTAVTITGTNFVSGATVNFGGAVATNVVVSSSTTITAVTPAKSAGTVDVTVTNPDAQSGILPNGFTYISLTPDTQAPTAPGTPMLTVVSASQINLSWAASTDNVAVTGYQVERCQGTGCNSFVQVATPSGTTYNDVGLTAGTNYSYRVRATDAVPNLSEYSGIASATTLSPDTQAPTVPGTPVLTVISASQINLSWAASTDNVAVTGYQVERCQGTGCNSFVQVATPSGTTYNDIGLTAGTSYSYRVRATDAVPNLSGYSGIASATTLSSPPSSTGLVLAYGFSEGTGTSTGDGSSNNHAGAIAGATWTTQGKYGNALIFNGTTARVSTPNTSDLQFTSAMTLEAWVNPSTVNSAWRDVIFKGDDNYYLMATTTRNGGWPGVGGRFGTPPSYGETFGTALLAANTWTHLAATYDGATLRLYVNGVQVSSVAKTGSLLTSTNPLQIGSDSFYGQYFAGTLDEIRVYNRALSASEIQTDMNTAVTNPTPDTQAPTVPGTPVLTVASASQINLSWAASTDNVAVTGYQVERCQGAGCSSFVQVATPSGTSYNDVGLTAGTSYSYRVRATDAVPNLSGYSGIASATTLAPDTQAPTVPGTPVLTVASASQINLNWTASTDNIAVTGYQVERCQGTGCSSFVQVATPSGTTYNDIGLTAGTSYSYRVRATDAVPNLSGYSGIASATTLSAPPPSTGLVLAYGFSEGSGTSTGDGSGNNHAGAIAGATWTTQGKYGNALIFNGTTARVSTPNTSDLQFTSAMTLEAWVNPSTVNSAWRDVIFKGDDNYYLMATTTRNGGWPGVGGRFGTPPSYGETFGTALLAANTWTHLAATYDGATLRLYVNGVQVSSVAKTGSLLTSTNPLQIGSDSFYGQYFAGTLDEIRVYNRALSASEIQTDMATPIP